MENTLVGDPVVKAPSPGSEVVDIPLCEAAGDHAPFIFFDVASAFGHYNNVVHTTLEALRFSPASDGGVTRERVVVGHLRMNVAAAESLLKALHGALLMARQPGSDAKN